MKCNFIVHVTYHNRVKGSVSKGCMHLNCILQLRAIGL